MPAPLSATLLSINIISHKGKQLLHGKWPLFVNELRNGLQQTGLQNPESTNNLLIFNFNHPFTALSSLMESLNNAKQVVQWYQELGSAPIQAVIHLDNPAERFPDLFDVTANLWNFLEQEAIYLTRALKVHWEALMAGKKLPAMNLEDDSSGLFRLKFIESAQVRVERLFPCREMALSGKEKECFYCSRTNHKPSQCPSKLLTMETQGLQEAGFLSFSQLGEIYKETFSAPDQIIALLASGVDHTAIKKNRSLQVFLAYFDLFRIYQPRFLHHVAFTFYLKWEDIGRMDRVEIDSNNLNMGLDCLRVRQYAEAKKWLSSDNLRRDGKDFYASVGLAFLALEQERERDMGTLLERANDLAESDKDRIYIGLLLARYYLLTNDLWKAEQTANTVLTFHAECTEAKYAKIRAGIKSGFKDQAFAQMGTLVKAYKEYFMAALMDPAIIPIQGLVEEVLTAHLQNLYAAAKENLVEVIREWESLKEWLGENDKLIQANINSVITLQKHFDRGNYFDLLTVSFRSKNVVASCHRIRRERLEFLDEKIATVAESWEGYHKFWKSYPYQSLFGNFIKSLAMLNNRLSELSRLAKKEKGIAFLTAMDQLVAIYKDMEKLKPQITKMVWAREILGGALGFAKKLLIAEAALNLLVFLILALLNTVFVDQIGMGLRNLVTDSWIQKKSLLLTTFLLAPMVSLGLTFWDKSEPIDLPIAEVPKNFHLHDADSPSPPAAAPPSEEQNQPVEPPPA